MAEVTTMVESKKRKRTGKAREEAKQRAIEAAKVEAKETDQEADKAEDAQAEPDVPVKVDDEAETMPSGAEDVKMEEPTFKMTGANAQEVIPRKRKRTGKMRAEAKAKAIAAKEAAALLAAENGEEIVVDEAEVKEEVKEEEGLDFEKIAKRIPQAIKKLRPIFKQSKKTESMRLIKKIRFLKSKDSKADEAAELEAQLKLISIVQVQILATTHLGQKLKKHHKLKHADLPEDVTTLLTNEPSIKVSTSSTTPALISKAENRLCSAKAVADAMGPAVAWILSEPGATLTLSAKALESKKQASAKSAAKRAAAADSDDDDDDEDEGSIADVEDDEEEEDFEDIGGPVTSLDSDDEAVMQSRAADAAGWESGSLGGGDSDNDEDAADAAGWESGSVSGDYNIAPPSSGPDSESEGEQRPAKKSKASLVALLTAKPTKPTKPEPKGKAEKPSKTAEKPGKAGSSSMFLPSLAAGFAAGDSDSDPDNDYDPDGIIGTKKAERKNRRGQRARQAIWEKKYGKGAKHVVKRREEEAKGPDGQKPDGGWSARGKGGVAPDTAPVLRRPFGAGARPAAGAPAAPGAGPKGPKGLKGLNPNAKSVDMPAAKDSAKDLHPSWEAARLRKQKMMDGADGAKATKIVFD